MATQTTNLHLAKPDYSDAADIAVINGNMDTIDAVSGSVIQTIVGSTNTTGHTINSGEYFVANGSKYKATASIPNGSAWAGSETAVSENDIINSLNGRIPISLDQTSSPENGFINLNTDVYVVANRIAAIEYVYENFVKTNKCLTHTVRFYGGHYHGYLFLGTDFELKCIEVTEAGAICVWRRPQGDTTWYNGVSLTQST